MNQNETNETVENKKQGGISVETQHIFPIIKKWLYSDKDIFVREIVSNASDAITKLKRLVSLGQIPEPADGAPYAIRVTLDRDARTLTVSDNGIGMSEEEVEKYICSIALSGALDFIKQYEGENDANASGIIGHFGLGFYSAFMIADTVELYTRSYTDAPAVHWTCNSAGVYTIEPADKKERGTEVVMHIAESESEYLDSSKIRAILDKYCAFMPEDIFYFDGSENAKETQDDMEDAENAEDGTDSTPAAPKPINDREPLWKKLPSACTDEEYKAFYHKVFGDYRDPLFWIHINADYPLNFRGILYFPPIGNRYESLEGQVKLFYNQVFVADNIKEVIPEYLLMLRGVLDCPELPLNVSRSYLQDNAYVNKVSAHIVKKVADKLNSLCLNQREDYDKVWGDIRTFVEYACCRDRKFYDRVKDSLLLTLTDRTTKTLQEYLDAVKEKHENTVYYTTDPALQAQYISLFGAQEIPVAVLDIPLDMQYIAMLESYRSEVHYKRVDADAAEVLSGDGETTDNEALTALFREVSGKEDLKVAFRPLKDQNTPVILNVSEESRRMDDMMKMYASGGVDFGAMQFPVEQTLVVNTASPVITKLTDLCAEDNHDRCALIAKQLYALATLSQRKLSAEELSSFLSDSFHLLSLL